MNKEIWKDIPEYERLYQASNLGRIKSCSKLVKRYATGMKKFVLHPYPEKIKKLRKDKYYLKINLCKYGTYKTWFVHKLIALTFLGQPISKNLVINHIDNNKLNNNIDNLCYVNISENNWNGSNWNGIKRKYNV